MADTLNPKPRAGTDNTASETTPLLGSTADSPIHSTNDGEILTNRKTNDEGEEPINTSQDTDKPLPKLQIFLLCFAALVEPVAFFGILPFINKMVFETGHLKETEVGFYAGLIESLFSITQMMLMIGWGKAADRIGRKPVLVFSLAGVSLATVLFGLSKTILQMIVFRCCAGVFAGTVVTLRAMISEHSTKVTQARAFSFFAFSRNLGIMLGPVIGGALADPQETYGGIFNKIAFLCEYPYALSTFVTGSIGFIATIVSGLFITETLEKTTKDESDPPPPATMTIWELVKTPGVAIVLALYAHAMLLGLAFTAICPTFWFTSVHDGGFGFAPIQISGFFAAIGISQALWLLLAFPYLQHRFGTGAILRTCYYFWPLFFIAVPACNLFLRWGGGWTTVFWILAPVLQIGGSGISMAFTGVQLALNDIAPNQRSLGTLNSLALTLVSGTRAFCPALFNSLFAIGVDKRIMHGYLAWLVLTLIALLGTVGIRWLPEKAEGRPVKHTEDSE